MQRNLRSSNNGAAIVAYVPEANAGTGVSTIEEIIAKYSLVKENTVGIPNGPTPLRDDGLLARSLLPGLSMDPYQLVIPTQISNKTVARFDVLMADAFTDYQVSVSKGSVRYKDGFIYYTPEPGYVGSVTLTFETFTRTFSTVERLLISPIILEYNFGVLDGSYLIMVKYLSAEYTDGTTADADLAIVSLTDSTGASVAYSGFDKAGDGYVSFMVSVQDTKEDVIKVQFAYQRGSLVGPVSSVCTLDMTSARRVQVASTFTNNNIEYSDDKSLFFVSPLEYFWPGATQAASVSPIIYKRDETIAMYGYYERLTPASSATAFGKGSFSKSGKRLYVAHQKGTNGAVTGGVVVIYEWSTTLKTYVQVGTIPYRLGIPALGVGSGGTWGITVSANGSETEVLIAYTTSTLLQAGGTWILYDVTNAAAPVYKASFSCPFSTSEAAWTTGKAMFYNNTYMYITCLSSNSNKGDLAYYKKNASGNYAYVNTIRSTMAGDEMFSFYECRILDNVIAGTALGQATATNRSYVQWMTTSAADVRTYNKFSINNAMFGTTTATSVQASFSGFDRAKNKLMFTRIQNQASGTTYSLYRITINTETGAYIAIENLTSIYAELDVVLKAHRSDSAIGRIVSIDTVKRQAVAYAAIGGTAYLCFIRY